MGANNVLPTVPTFTAGAPSLAQLNQLSYAASFLVNANVRPEWMVFSTATQSVAANTWTNVAFNKVQYDSDGVAGAAGANLPAVKIVTQGYYSLEACVQVQGNSGTNNQFTPAFLFTAGPNNAHYAANSTYYFGFRGGKTSSTAQAAGTNANTPCDITPMVLYPGDQLNVAVYITAAMTLDFNQNTSYVQGRFSTKFTGYWVRTGT